MKGGAVNPARPYRHFVAAIERREFVEDRRRRQEDMIGIAVEAPQIGLHGPAQEAEMIIFGVGFEARVKARDYRNAGGPRIFLRLAAQDVGRREMDDIGRERLQIGAGSRRKAERKAIFGAPRDARRAYRDNIADRFERLRRRGRRIDADRHSCAIEQIGDEAVERPIGAIAHAVVIAREERDAQRPAGGRTPRDPPRFQNMLHARFTPPRRGLFHRRARRAKIMAAKERRR